MHEYNEEIASLADAIFSYARNRIQHDFPMDGPMSEEQLRALVGVTITEEGLGGLKALELFDDVLSRACLSVDHPRLLAFVPAAPSEARAGICALGREGTTRSSRPYSASDSSVGRR